MLALKMNKRKIITLWIALAMVPSLAILMPASAQQASQQGSDGVQREARSGLPANCTTAAYMQDGGAVTLENKSYEATKSGVLESVVCVTNGGWLTLKSAKISKYGNEENKEDFGGQGVEASGGSVVNIIDGEIFTDTLGGNGLWATDEGSLIYMRGGSITTLESSGHGVDTTIRASVILYDVKISTSGEMASGALVNDSGDGTVYATRVTANTKGYGSPGFYMIGSKSMLTIKDSSIVAETSDAGVLLYSADVTVTNSILKGAKGVKVAGGTFTMTGGSLTATDGDAFTIVSGEDGPSGGGAQGGAPGGSAPGGARGGEGARSGDMAGGGMPGGEGARGGDMAGGMPGGEGARGGDMAGGMPGGAAPGGGGGLFGGARGGDSTITLQEGVKISSSTGNIISVPADNKAVFTADSTDLTGDMVVAETGTLNVTLSKSTLEGTVTGASITLDGDSKWYVTGDSVLTTLNNSGGISGNEITNIYGNGHTVYYNAELDENKALGGKTYSLAKGGKLAPK